MNDVGRLRVSLALVIGAVAAAGCGESFTATEGAGGTAGTGGDAGTAASSGTTVTGECQGAESRPCYEGPTGTNGIGVCHAGSQVCIGGAWGPCEGQVTPGAAEICDGGQDEDCNGSSEEGCDCATGASEGCYGGSPGTEGVGPCHGGTKQCVDNMWSECMGQVIPAVENCDGVDNDCNTQTDDVVGIGTDCMTELVGACAEGSLQCTGDNILPVCVSKQPPATEVCDGVDNDCNGKTDESFPLEGAVCSAAGCQGTYACLDAVQTCVFPPNNLPEICNDGLDNDCDGEKDPSETVYFGDDFASNAGGWTLGLEWAIGVAVGAITSPPGFYPDPAADHTNTLDNRLAGVVIGGDASIDPHEPRYITSKAVDLSGVAGSVVLSYWRRLNSDAPPQMTSTVDVYDGVQWITIWSNFDSGGNGLPVADSTWKPQVFNVTAYKNSTFRVRFGVEVGVTIDGKPPLAVGSWSVDDVRIASCF